jgi:hypothetical protein
MMRQGWLRTCLTVGGVVLAGGVLLVTLGQRPGAADGAEVSMRDLAADINDGLVYRVVIRDDRLEVMYADRRRASVSQPGIDARQQLTGLGATAYALEGVEFVDGRSEPNPIVRMLGPRPADR